MSLLARSSRMAPILAKTASASSAAVRVASAQRHLSSTAAVMSDSVLYESVGSTRIYKLNRPKALNALDQDMIESLAKQAQTWRTSELCQLIIGRGDERAFCAGGDVKTLVESRPESGGAVALKFFKDEFELNWEMGRFGKPYVAVIDGFTMGGGAGISLPAGVRIATKKTVFAMPETKIGYSPDVGGNYYIAQLDGEIGAWLAITGQETWGRAVYELGIATHYVEPESIPALVEQLQNLENPDLQTVSMIVSSYHVPAPPSGTAVSSRASREGPTPVTGAIRTLLDKTFGLASIQEIYAALQNAEGDSALPAEAREWATAQREIMDNRSPTGMAVALANFKLAKSAKRLHTALENDITMATAFVGTDRATEEFTTGVTHVLISKAKGRADWSPSDINDAAVTPAAIAKNFLDRNNARIKDEIPALNFVPEPTTTEGPDSTWGQFRKYGLPSEAEVRAWIMGEAPGSGAFKLREDELVQRISDARGETAGPRQGEIEQAVRNIVAARGQKDADGYLNWH